MSNLKALGIFRIISEQKDNQAMAYWENDAFVLQTKMTQEDLIKFFLEEYVPTPIVSPWNNGSGFYDVKENHIDAIKESDSHRLEKYRRIINRADEILKDMFREYEEFVKKRDQNIEKGSPKNESLEKLSKEIKKITDKGKSSLLVQCRNRLDKEVIPWMDAAYVAASGKPTYGPVLGTGGNDGNLDISDSFMKWIRVLIIHEPGKNEESSEWISNSFFATASTLRGSSFGYFHPGGYTGESVNGKIYSLVNPWDFVLTIEGTMVFAGSISRRSNSRRAAFPFCTDPSTAGYGTACDEKVRGEIWIPLWKNPVTYDEIRYVFNEGRVQMSSKNSNSGVDFAKAVASLGTERGLSSFQRFGLFERKGQAYFANSIGRIKARDDPKVILFSEIDYWINRIHGRHNRTKKSSKFIDSLLRNMDNAIIKFCTYGTTRYLQDVLIIIGKMERAVSQSSNYNSEIEPLEKLSDKWAHACNDDTPEFRLAVSLAAMASSTQKRLRVNLEPVEIDRGRVKWKHGSSSTVWRNSNLASNMIRVLERRCIEGQMSDSEISLNSAISAPVKDVTDFIEGRVNYDKIYDLLLPLSMIDYRKDHLPDYCNLRELWEIPDFVPESYIVLKSNFPSITFKNADTVKKALFEPSMLGSLKGGKIGRAVHTGRRRLRITGYNIITYSNTASHVSTLSKQSTNRIAASLLFPLDRKDQQKIISRICKGPPEP